MILEHLEKKGGVLGGREITICYCWISVSSFFPVIKLTLFQTLFFILFSKWTEVMSWIQEEWENTIFPWYFIWRQITICWTLYFLCQCWENCHHYLYHLESPTVLWHLQFGYCLTWWTVKMKSSKTLPEIKGLQFLPKKVTCNSWFTTTLKCLLLTFKVYMPLLFQSVRLKHPKENCSLKSIL